TISSGGTSAYSSSLSYTTPTTCGSASGLTSTSVTTTGATLTWTAVSGAVSDNVQYRVTSTSTWSSANTTSATLLVNNLTPASNYEWQVQTVCASGSSAFTNSSTFATNSLPCSIPTGLTSSATTTGATLNWTTVSGAVSYNVHYRVTS